MQIVFNFNIFIFFKYLHYLQTEAAVNELSLARLGPRDSDRARERDLKITANSFGDG